MQPTTPSPFSSTTPASSPEVKTPDKKSLKPALLICGTLILILVVILVIVLVRKKAASPAPSPEETSEETPAESSEVENSTIPNDSGEPEEFHSLEELVNQENAIINNPASPSGEVFDARIRLAAYYLSFEQVNDAKAVMDSVDPNSLDTMQTMRYANTMYDIYTILGDDDARGRYHAMSVNARNKLVEEQGQK